MPTLRASIELYDGATSPLMSINQALNAVISSFEAMRAASGQAIDVPSVQAVNNDLSRTRTQLDSVSIGLEEANQSINRAENSTRSLQDSFAQTQVEAEGINRELEEASRNTQRVESSAGSLTNTVRNLAGAYLGIEGLKALVTASDSMTQITARLDMMNDGLQTTAELNQMVYESAQRSRGSYQDTANFIAKLGTLTEGVFDSNEELIAFAEQINKQMALSGTTAQEASGAMLQLTQALSSGTLRGEELNSVLEGTPMVAQTIAKYMGVSVGEMRNLASEGAITAEIVKNAMLSAADETNAAFESMPMTWAQVWNSFSNTALIVLQPILSAVNGLANNFDIIAPIALGAAAAVGVYMIAAHGAAAATAIWTKAQAALTAVMALNPVGLIAISVVILISLLYAGVAAMNKFSGTSVSATGIVAGAFTALAAHTLNTYIIPAMNWFSMLGNFIGNVFNNPVAAVKVLFYDMVLNILGYIKNLAHGIEDLLNSIPTVEVSITGSLDNLYEQVKGAAASAKAESGWVEYFKTFDYIDYNKAYKTGYEYGQGLEERFTGGFNVDIPQIDIPSFDSLDTSGIMDALDGIAGDTSSISDSMEITEEDLKYLRDIATREAINRFTTAQIKIDQKNENHIASDMDVDGIMDIFAVGFADRLNVSAEGVHV